MKVVGIIAEYNPFHQGHAYHLAQARAITNADYVLAVMSGNYVQRGVPAMFDKYTRAEAALRNGADLVLELPLDTATGSAEYFASGAVSLLEASGLVTDLCFGSECGSLTSLEQAAELLTLEPENYRLLLKMHLKAGQPYPKARALALQECLPGLSADCFTSPNNLLGLEYLKALKRAKSSIRPHTIQRIGAGYHDQHLTEYHISSASGIRAALLQSKGCLTPDIRVQLPSGHVYQSYEGKPPITEDAFSLLLLEKLQRLHGQPLNEYFDVTVELANRVTDCLDDYSSFSQFTDLLKTRNLTRTAVSRALLHILLDIREYHSPTVLRVLGFQKEAAPLLGALSEKGRLPVITGLAGAELPSSWPYADRLYESVRCLLHESPYQNEYRRKMLVI